MLFRVQKQTLQRIDRLGLDMFKFSIHPHFLTTIKWQESDRENWERSISIEIETIHLAVGNDY